MSINFPVVSWSKGSNIYEVNVRQYSVQGSFKAFQSSLPRLKEMGVEILWFMPITPISQEKKKGSLGSYYACSSYTEINPEFGNKEDFKTLVDQAHQMGFKVIIDWVANHTGWQHEWTIHKDWYVLDQQNNFTEIHNWDDVIDLNYDNEDMQDAMIAAMRYWVGNFDIDGFRCDMAHLVRLDFWQRARKSCEEIKPLFWLGECDQDNYSEVFDVTYAWRWMHATEAFAKNNAAFARILDCYHQYQGLPSTAQKAYFTSNHDENSWNGTEYEKYGMPLAQNLAVLSILYPGIPLVYSGQELPNYKRLKFFDKDCIDWDPQQEPKLQAFYATLLSIRKTNKAFHLDATFTWINQDNHQSSLAFFLENEADRAIIFLNFSATEKISISFAHEKLQGDYIQLFSGIAHQLKKEETFEVMPHSYLVYVSK